MADKMDKEKTFKYYLENFFSIPEDLKNDVVYCQRATLTFIKVHQMVSDVFKQQPDADPVQKQRILDELESDLFEINAELQYLLLRLNDSLDQFYKFVSRKGVEVVQSYAKAFVGNILSPLVCDMTYIACPRTVKERPNINSLIRRHFLVSSDSNDTTGVLVSNLDSELELSGLAPNNSEEAAPQAASSPVPSVISVSDDDDHIIENDNEQNNQKDLNNLNYLSHDPNDPNDLKDEEICGLEEEMNQIIINEHPEIDDYPEENPIEEVYLVENLENFYPFEPSLSDGLEIIDEGRVNAAPKSSRRSRKTKQQPRVFVEEEDAKLVLNNLTLGQSFEVALSPEDPVDDSQPETAQGLLIKSRRSNKLATSSLRKNATITLPTKKKYGGVIKKKTAEAVALVKAKKNNNKKNSRKMSGKKATNSNAPSSSGTSTSVSITSSGNETNIFSSDDSNLEHRQPIEPVELRTLPIEYGQEAFLAMYDLFTPPALAHMQQRRSKRQRRNIHTTERSDFHYERFELMHADGTKKKNKEFLLSPKVKRMRAKKGNNAAASAAISNTKRLIEEIGDQPSTSTGLSRGQYWVIPRRGVKSPPSPNDKLKCKECRKDNEPLLPCSVCDHMFHQACHEDGGKPHAHIKCPMCYSNWKTEMLKKIHTHSPQTHNFRGYGNKKGDGGGGSSSGLQTK